MTEKQRDALLKIQNSDALFLRVDDIAPILGSNPQHIRDTAKRGVYQLGFPALVVNSTVKIPRKPFLIWLGEKG